MIDNPGEVKTFVIHSKGSIIGTKEILREARHNVHGCLGQVCCGNINIVLNELALIQTLLFWQQ